MVCGQGQFWLIMPKLSETCWLEGVPGSLWQNVSSKQERERTQAQEMRYWRANNGLISSPGYRAAVRQRLHWMLTMENSANLLFCVMPSGQGESGYINGNRMCMAHPRELLGWGSLSHLPLMNDSLRLWFCFTQTQTGLGPTRDLDFFCLSCRCVVLFPP